MSKAKVVDCRVEFHGNLNDLAKETERLVDIWLEEASGELEGQVKDISRVDTGQTKISYGHVVDTRKKEAHIGSPLQNAIWEEYGTGEYALEGKGRKGGWYIPIGYGENQIAPETVEKYHFKVVYGKNGMKYAFTEGKKPSRPIYKAFSENEEKVINRLETMLKGTKK